MMYENDYIKSLENYSNLNAGAGIKGLQLSNSKNILESQIRTVAKDYLLASNKPEKIEM